MVMKILITLLVCLFAASAFAQTVHVDLNKASLAWDWVKGTGDDATGFKTKCGLSAGTYTIIKSWGPTIRQVNLKDAITTPGKWFCVVTAFNDFGESGPSNEISFNAGAVPVAPSDLKVQAQ